MGKPIDETDALHDPDNDIECPHCGEEYTADSFWDGFDTCPHCGKDAEWEIEGETEGGFFFGPITKAGSNA